MEQKFSWLISEENFKDITNNGEWDGYLFMLWDNGITTPEDAKRRVECERFQYTLGPDCPFCGTIDKHYVLNTNQYRCKNKKCLKKFSITSRTYIDSTKLEYYHWIRFAYLVGTLKITNSHAISRDLGITQSTAWQMLRILRVARRENTENLDLSGKFAEPLFKSCSEVLELLLKRKIKPEPTMVTGQVSTEDKTNNLAKRIEALLDEKALKYTEQNNLTTKITPTTTTVES